MLPVATPRKSRDEGVDVAVSNVAPTTTPQKATGSPTLPPIDAGNSQAPKAGESKAQTVLPPIQNHPSDKDQVDVPAAEAGDAHTFTVADALVEHAQEAATLENQADKVQKEPDPSEQPQSREKEVVQTTEVPKEDLQESSTSQDGQRPPEESDEPQEAEVVAEPVIIPPQEKAGPSSPRKKMDMRRRMNNTTTGPGSFGTAQRLSAHPATASGIHQALIVHPSDFDVAKDSSRGSKAQRPNTEKGIDFWSSDPLPSPGRGVPGPKQGHTKWTKKPGPNVHTIRRRLDITSTRDEPGPGEYPVNRDLKSNGNGNGFAKAFEKRFHPGRAGAAPGPASYATEGKLPHGNAAQHGGWSISGRARRELTFSTIL